MATITTKYSVGDAVFHAWVTTERKQHPCPDCMGARKWTAKSPAGSEYTFACPRCAASFNSDRDLTLDYSAYVSATRKLTVGSVQYNSAPDSHDHGARYMCRETGVGSGSVYNENDLFQTEEEAMAAAQIKATLANTKTEWIVKLYNKSLSISNYQLESAAMHLAKEAKNRANSLLWNLNGLFSTIEEADDKEAIIEAVEDYKKYEWEDDKKKAGLSTEIAPCDDAEFGMSA
jgi:hypothetical protein